MLITQNSRLVHHTVVYTGLTGTTIFTVPTSEDFSDGSWTPFDLNYSEIGVAESQGRAFIRIGSTIKEFNLTASGSTGSSIFNYWRSGATGTGSLTTNVGSLSEAYADYSTAVGHLTETRGINSFASGQNVIASGETSFVHGFNSLAAAKFSVVLGTDITGHSQSTVYVNNLNINKGYTPSGTSDSYGEVGMITYDLGYIYVKNNDGWKRSALTTF